MNGQFIGASVREDLRSLERRASVNLQDEPRSSATDGLVVSGNGHNIFGKNLVRAVFRYGTDGLLQGIDIIGHEAEVADAFQGLVGNAAKVKDEDGLFQRGQSFARMTKLESKEASLVHIEVMSASLLAARQLAAAQKAAYKAKFRDGVLLALCLVIVVVGTVLIVKGQPLPKKVEEGERAARSADLIVSLAPAAYVGYHACLTADIGVLGSTVLVIGAWQCLAAAIGTTRRSGWLPSKASGGLLSSLLAMCATPLLLPLALVRNCSRSALYTGLVIVFGLLGYILYTCYQDKAWVLYLLPCLSIVAPFFVRNYVGLYTKLKKSTPLDGRSPFIQWCCGLVAIVCYPFWVALSLSKIAFMYVVRFISHWFLLTLAVPGSIIAKTWIPIVGVAVLTAGETAWGLVGYVFSPTGFGTNVDYRLKIDWPTNFEGVGGGTAGGGFDPFDPMTPAFNVDGTPMMGAFDIHGHAYGMTSIASFDGGAGGFMDVGGGHDPFA